MQRGVIDQVLLQAEIVIEAYGFGTPRPGF